MNLLISYFYRWISITFSELFDRVPFWRSAWFAWHVTRFTCTTTQLLTTFNFIGPWYHAALLFSGLGSIVLLFVLLFSQQIREDLVRRCVPPFNLLVFRRFNQPPTWLPKQESAIKCTFLVWTKFSSKSVRTGVYKHDWDSFATIFISL